MTRTENENNVSEISASKQHSSMSRRKFLEFSAFLSLAAIAQACAAPGSSAASNEPGFSPSSSAISSPEASGIVASSTPESSPSLPNLTGDTFTKVFSRLDAKTKITIPQEGNTNIAKTTDELAAYASSAWRDNITSDTISRNPLHALEFALAAAESTRMHETVDMSKIFPELSLSLPRFSINTLPNSKNIETTINISPQNLTLRKGVNMTVLGINGDNAVVAFSDTIRNPQKNPTMYFGILPLEAKGQQKDGIVSLQDILSLNGATYDSNSKSILYTDTGKTLPLYSIESAFDKNILNRAGSYFLDLDPLKKNKDGTPAMEGNPVISILPSQFASDKIIQLKDGRIGAQDTNGKLVARTRYSFAQNGWEWATDKESLQDFTIREYADAMDIPFSVFTDKSLFGNPEYDLSIETTANEIVIAAELDPNRVFGDFSIDDLNKILSNWNSITSSLNQGIIPEGFNYNWKDADIVVRYAKEHNMNLSAQHLFWSGESYTFPDSLTKGNFNNEELNKLLEFMVKTRVIKYKGIIDEWEGAAEVAGQLSYAQPSFLIGKLGMGIIDKVFTWAHEANPDAKLRYTEDQVLETDNPSLINGFWQLLRHFKDANVPVDAITAENNMWIYTPPDKQHMIDVLKQIKNMGYEIGTPETTVVTSNIFPIWPTRKRTVDTVTDIFKAQAKIYENIADSYLQAGTKVFGLGGFTDADEWYKVLASYDTNAMIFDKNYQPKPSYFALLNVLKKYI